MGLRTPSKTGAVRDCCVEGRRRVTHRADAACGWFTPRVPHDETSRRAGCLNRARPVRCAGMGNGALPNGPSYRAHPRLYHRVGSLLRTDSVAIACISVIGEALLPV